MWDAQDRHPEMTMLQISEMGSVSMFSSYLGRTETAIFRLGCEVETHPGNLLPNPDMEAPSAPGNVFGWGLSYHDNTRDPRVQVDVDYRPHHGRMALRLIVPTATPVLLPVSNAGATPAGCSGGDQGFQMGKKGGRYTISFWARSSVVGMSVQLMSGFWLGHDSNYTGSALANTTLGTEWAQVHASTTINDDDDYCLQVRAGGVGGMLFLDDFFVGENSTVA